MIRFAFGIATAIILSSACGMGTPTGETRHETVSFDLDKSESMRVTVKMGAGELSVTGGSGKLAEGDFKFNVDAWKPDVVYRPGDLSITQPSSMGSFGNTVNEWKVKLNEQLPMDITASLGAGDATLEFGKLNLQNVNVNLGAGDLKLDLRGEPKRSYTVRVTGGVGEATIQLPRDVGISATAAGGIGEISTSGLENRGGVWINPDRVGAPVTVTLDVKGGVGEIHLIR